MLRFVGSHRAPGPRKPRNASDRWATSSFDHGANIAVKPSPLTPFCWTSCPRYQGVINCFVLGGGSFSKEGDRCLLLKTCRISYSFDGCNFKNFGLAKGVFSLLNERAFGELELNVMLLPVKKGPVFSPYSNRICHVLNHFWTSI